MTMPHALKRSLEQVTTQEIVELMQESSDDRALAAMQNHEIVVPENPDHGLDISRGDTIVLEELVYPYEFTHQLLRTYNRTYFVGDFDKKMIFRKLLRSCRHWRIRPPSWLREVVK
jgi:hypothetical protein